MQKLVALVVILIVPLAFAGRPPASVLADTVTGGDGPAVQSIGSSNTAQPVAVMNWLIDENGNLKVSNQVRDQVIVLADSAVTIPALGGVYESPWFSTRTFNVMYVHGPIGGINCNIEWRWSESIPVVAQDLDFTPGYPYSYDPTHPWRIVGPEARIRCANFSNEDFSFDFVAVYLRAE